jgi:DNA-damage-inducible protein D
MQKEIIEHLHSCFEEKARTENGVTYWYAREIQPLLEYTEWRNFSTVIEKAKVACQMADQDVNNHFVDINKMVEVGSGVSREIKDLMLTRYACYLIAQNADPSKEAVAFAQSYFAIQTRKQEVLEERLHLAERIQARAKLTETERQLSNTLYLHGVDERGFGAVRSMGDNALFGGNNTAEMKRRLGVKPSKPLADFLPTVTLKAKEFAAAITDFNVRKLKMWGANQIGNEHVKNNKDVRAVLEKSNIRPEELPPEEDIQKLERRVRSDGNRLLKSEAGLQAIQKKDKQ